MKAVVYDAPRSSSITDIPDPAPRPGEVRIKVIQVGVCGTDLHIHNGDFNAAFPLIPGHELVGTVEAIGNGVTRVRVGEQVSVNPNVNCGLCDYCLAGNPIRCSALQGLGSTFPGFFAEYVVVHERLVFSTEGLPIDTAVFTEPAACATHGLERLKIWPGSSALVFGAGPTGLMLAQLIKSGGAASVTVAAPTQFKLERARAFGIDQTIQISRTDPVGNQKLAMEASGGRGYDIVVEATGATIVGDICVGLTPNGGTMLVYGVTRADETLSVHPFEVFRREISTIGSFAEITSFSRLRLRRCGRVASAPTGSSRTDSRWMTTAPPWRRSDPTSRRTRCSSFPEPDPRPGEERRNEFHHPLGGAADLLPAAPPLLATGPMRDRPAAVCNLTPGGWEEWSGPRLVGPRGPMGDM